MEQIDLKLPLSGIAATIFCSRRKLSAFGQQQFPYTLTGGPSARKPRKSLMSYYAVGH